MAEYNFEPEYSLWLKKDNLSKEQLIWLMFGINAEDIRHNLSLSSKTDITQKEQEWLWAFRNYCDSCNHFLGNHARDYMKLLKSTSKDKIFQEAYEAHMKINGRCKSALLESGLLKPSEKLEKYKEHAQYEAEVDLTTIPKTDNENQALAVMLVVEPRQFDRFINLDDKCVSEPSDENGYVAYVKFSPDEKWFYSEYGDFLKTHYDAHHTSISNFSREVRKYCKWEGDFSKYCQLVHDGGVIFRKKTYEHLVKKGVILEYSHDGWAYKFYSDWVKRKPLWSAELAAKLYTGSDPNNGRGFYGFGEFEKGEAGYSLHDSKTVMFLDENGEWNDPVLESFEKETSLHEFVKRHVAKGTLKFMYDDGDGNYEFEPLEITKFFKQHCPNTYQPQALFEVLGMNENHKSDEIKAINISNDNNKRELALASLEKKLTNAGYDLNVIPFSQDELAQYLNKQDGFQHVTSSYIKTHYIKKREGLSFRRGARGRNLPAFETVISTN